MSRYLCKYFNDKISFSTPDEYKSEHEQLNNILKNKDESIKENLKIDISKIKTIIEDIENVFFGKMRKRVFGINIINNTHKISSNLKPAPRTATRKAQVSLLGISLNRPDNVERKRELKRLNSLKKVETIITLKAQMNATRNGPGKQKLKHQYDTLFKELTETFSL